MFKILFFVTIILATISNSLSDLLPACVSEVYCYGPLLHTVQMARIFNDSKEFVDMKMINNYTTTLTNFDKLMKITNNKPTKGDMVIFIKQNFQEANELDIWTPSDFNEEPKFLQKISNPIIREFAQELINIWPNLGRKIKDEILEEEEKYTIIPVPNGFIIPGGRFREYYYWDSYWIIKGLLISEMDQTAQEMLDNFIHLIKTYGFIPNGGRIYYLNRSQPPLLTKMVSTYISYTNNTQWLQQNINFLEEELNFWLTKRTKKFHVKSKWYNLAHYDAESSGPRPESYYEDFTTANFYPNQTLKEQLYVNLKSGGESGWDFSSRWLFDDEGKNLGNLTNLQTKRVIPVDLNSYLCESFYLISELYQKLSDHNKSSHWKTYGDSWKKSIEEVLWDEEDGIWYDFDQKLSQPRRYFYPSNVAPLWSNCFDESKKDLGDSVLNYLSMVGVLDTPGGIAASLAHTGEQWDFPNAWAPLQATLAQGLQRSGSTKAKEVAKDIAYNWIKATILGFRDTGELYEKYDALTPGKFGGGGEYVVQAGFGWTNGVALEFIDDYFTINSSEF